MGRAVGIDLGTTYSAVATLGSDGVPTVLANAEGGTDYPLRSLLPRYRRL